VLSTGSIIAFDTIDRRRELRELVVFPLSVALMLGLIPPLEAQELTPNPGAWRPLVRTDLKTELPDNLTYIDIWTDAITANNRAYDAKGGSRAANENAPASDAHVVVRSPELTVVLTTLDTELTCKPAPFSESSGVTIKLCPTRLVIFEGALSSRKELPPSCYLEADPDVSRDPSADASYAAYDTVTKTIKTALVVDHKVIDECARFVPIPLERRRK
jgi:hypothetical protein